MLTQTTQQLSESMEDMDSISVSERCCSKTFVWIHLQSWFHCNCTRYQFWREFYIEINHVDAEHKIFFGSMYHFNWNCAMYSCCACRHNLVVQIM